MFETINEKEEEKLINDYSQLLKDFSPLSILNISPNLFPNGKYIQLSAYGEKEGYVSVNSKDSSFLLIKS